MNKLEHTIFKFSFRNLFFWKLVKRNAIYMKLKVFTTHLSSISDLNR